MLKILRGIVHRPPFRHIKKGWHGLKTWFFKKIIDINILVLKSKIWRLAFILLRNWAAYIFLSCLVTKVWGLERMQFGLLTGVLYCIAFTVPVSCGYMWCTVIAQVLNSTCPPWSLNSFYIDLHCPKSIDLMLICLYVKLWEFGGVL